MKRFPTKMVSLLSLVKSTNSLILVSMAVIESHRCMRKQRCLPSFFDTYKYHNMDLCNESCLSVLPAVFHDKNFNIGCFAQNVHQFLLFLPNFKGSIDFCHFVPLSLTLTFLWGHKVSTKQNLHTFQLIRMKFEVAMKQLKLNILRLLFDKV